MIARSHANTLTEDFVVQLSDRMDAEQVARALAHEVSKVTAYREQALWQRPWHDSIPELYPRRPDLLLTGQSTNSWAMSAEDRGRIGELNWLALSADSAPTADRRSAAASEFALLADHLGLRQDRPADVVNRGRVAGQHLTAQARSRLPKPTVPLEAGPPSHPTVPAWPQERTTFPAPEEDAKAARQAAEARARKSAETLEKLRAERAGGDVAHRFVIGAGAAVGALPEGAVLLDMPGRWHKDLSKALVQTGHQSKDLPPWLGDPLAFVLSPDRVGMTALTTFIDNAASKADAVDANASLVMGGTAN